MIQVTENGDNSFTISWDENSPTESILNTWTEEDFIRVLMETCEKLIDDTNTFFTATTHDQFMRNERKI